MEQVDAIVVGCGLTGGVIARHLAEKWNKRVRIIERRNHIAGNMYDFKDDNGFLIQQYGPHTFHTNEKDLYQYINRFENWKEYKLKCMAQIDNIFTPTPFNFKTIDDFWDKEKAELLKQRIKEKYGDVKKTTIVEMLQSEDELIKEWAEFLYNKDYSLYTAKQWGISPKEIDISVLKRVPVLFSYKEGYFDDTYQVMPSKSFTYFFSKIIEHKNIDVMLNTDARNELIVKDNKIFWKGKSINIPIIYTGPIDELLNYKYGVLPYRSLRFDYRTETTDSYQDAPVVAYPQAEGYTRITEYTKLPLQETNGKTVIAIEYPLQYDPNENTEPYYPILTEESNIKYNMYYEKLCNISNLFLCGRLADFKYYNMDQTLRRALDVCKSLDEFMDND